MSSFVNETFVTIIKILSTIKDTNNILTHKNLNGANPQGKTVDYNTIFTLSVVDNMSGTLSIDEYGKIKLSYVPTVDTNVRLMVSYKGAQAKEFVVTIRGVQLDYSPSGKMLDNDVSDKTTIQEYVAYNNGNTKLSIELADVSKFDCDNYFSFTTNDIQIYAVLVDNGGNVMVDSEVLANTEYSIAYAQLVGGYWQVVEHTGYTLIINPVSE